MFCLRQIPFIFKISIFFILVFITLPGSAVHAADVVLTWDRPDDARVTGYKIFYGPSDTDFKSSPKEIINSPEQTECDIYDLISGQTYSFGAKSIDDKGNESVFSEILHYDVLDTRDDDANDQTQNENSNKDAQDESSNGGGGGCFIASTIQ